MQVGTIYAIAGANIVLAITQYSTVFSQNQVYFGRKKNTPGRIISRCKSAGYPPAKFSGHDTLYRVAANCSDPRTVSGHHGEEQCDPQPLLWYSVPASRIPHTAGGSEGTLCLPSASGCHSRALRPAVLSLGGEACVSHKTLSPAQSVPDSLGVHKGLLVSSEWLSPPSFTENLQYFHA